MALKKLPGGVVVETTAGARLNEEAGVNLEAIHRQLAGQSAATADALNTKADVTALNAVRATAEAAQSSADSTLAEARRSADALESLNVTVTRTEVARNEVMDPLFKGNGWTGLQQVIGRSSWVESNGTATVTINTGTTAGNLLFEAIPDAGKAAPTGPDDRWSMSVVLGVPAGSPELTLRAGVGYGPGPAVALNYSQTQTVAPGTSKLFTVVNNAPSAGRTTAW